MLPTKEFGTVFKDDFMEMTENSTVLFLSGCGVGYMKLQNGLDVTLWILVVFTCVKNLLLGTLLQVLRPIRGSSYSLDFGLGLA